MRMHQERMFTVWPLIVVMKFGSLESANITPYNSWANTVNGPIQSLDLEYKSTRSRSSLPGLK